MLLLTSLGILLVFVWYLGIFPPESESKSCSVLSDIFQPRGLWNSSRQNTGGGSLSCLRGIFPTPDQTLVSHIAGRFFSSWATREALFPTKLLLFSMFRLPLVVVFKKYPSPPKMHLWEQSFNFLNIYLFVYARS